VKRAAVLARGQFRTGHAKTAHGLILHGQRYKIIAVIDETCAGRDAGEVMGIGRQDIPIVSSLSEVPPRTGALIIGVAPAGGRLPPAWRRDVRLAIRRGMDIVSGLHDFLGDDQALAALAKKHGVRIWDVRRPPGKLALARGGEWSVPVVLTSGTDCTVGKRTVTVELHRGARRRGIDAAFVATGQTGIMVGSDAGVVVDHVPGDFMSGAVEEMVRRMIDKGKELVFVQGQASLTHHAYGPVTLGILYGARPHYIVLVHEPSRRFRPSFPDQPVLEPMVEAALVKLLSGAEPIGISLNCAGCGGRAGAIARGYEARTGLTTVDVLRDGPDRMLDALLARLDGDRRFRPGPGLRAAIREWKGRKRREESRRS
jgi:uncharacterized NAD-dependent epimerase/dehydratase family protein